MQVFLQIDKKIILPNEAFIIIATTIIILFLAAILLFILFSQQKKKLERQQSIENIRARITRDLHDDVGATLSSVKAYAEILKDNPDNALVAELIKDNATEMITQLEVIAWVTNPKHDNFESFVDNVNRYAIPLCHSKNINYNFSYAGIKKEKMIPGEIRQHLYLVIKEAVNNTVKYSGASNCIISAAVDAGKFILEINDDGKGFDDQEMRLGNGLNNMQSRIKEIKGEILVSSVQSKGTHIKIELTYPFKNT